MSIPTHCERSRDFLYGCPSSQRTTNENVIKRGVSPYFGGPGTYIQPFIVIRLRRVLNPLPSGLETRRSTFKLHKHIWWAERELNSLGLNKVSVLQTEVPTLTRYPPKLLTYQVFISLKSLIVFCWFCS